MMVGIVNKFESLRGKISDIFCLRGTGKMLIIAEKYQKFVKDCSKIP